MEIISLQFLVPDDIQSGLVAGELIRKGGVIVKRENNAIVYWLKDAQKMKTKGNLLFKAPAVAQFAASATTFLYLNEKFKSLQKGLDEANSKLDSQIYSKIKSGLSLGVEAELLNDKAAASTQFSNARQSLDEGSNILKMQLKKISKKEKSFSEKRMFLMNLIYFAEFGVIRTYLYNKEFQLAKKRLLEVQQFILVNILQQIEDEFDQHINWYYYAALIPAIPFLGPKIIYDIITDRDYPKLRIAGEIKKLEKNNANIEGALSEVLVEVREKNISLSDNVKSLLLLRDSVEGYLIEMESETSPNYNMIQKTHPYLE